MRMLYVMAVLGFGVAVFSSSAAVAQDVSLRLSCQALVKHEAGGADYVPGVDVKGRPVVAADLNKNVSNLSYPIKIPIEIDVFSLLDLEASAFSGEGEVAYFMLYEDGRMEYNGQDFSDRVSYACAEDEEAADIAPSDIEAAPETTEATEATE